jgi:hypothetical protein
MQNQNFQAINGMRLVTRNTRSVYRSCKAIVRGGREKNEWGKEGTPEARLSRGFPPSEVGISTVRSGDFHRPKWGFPPSEVGISTVRSGDFLLMPLVLLLIIPVPGRVARKRSANHCPNGLWSYQSRKDYVEVPLIDESCRVFATLPRHEEQSVR